MFLGLFANIRLRPGSLRETTAYGDEHMSDGMTRIYHVCRRDEWKAAPARGHYDGSSQDKIDGFIHFSGADQVVASAAKHRAGQSGLLILEVDAGGLGPELRWEASRVGAIFPHLYKPLPVAAVVPVAHLPLGGAGRPAFPWGLS